VEDLPQESALSLEERDPEDQQADAQDEEPDAPAGRELREAEWQEEEQDGAELLAVAAIQDHAHEE